MPLFRRRQPRPGADRGRAGLSEAGARGASSSWARRRGACGCASSGPLDRQRDALLRRQMAGAAAAAASAERHPDIDVRISADRLVDFERDDVDIAIRYGRGNWPGLRVELLMRESLFAVCSPQPAGRTGRCDGRRTSRATRLTQRLRLAHRRVAALVRGRRPERSSRRAGRSASTIRT